MMRPALAAAAVLLIAGCAQIRTDEHDGLSHAERSARLKSVPAWEMRGRLAVDTGDEAFQGRFQWLQDGAHASLTVRGPLGAGGIRIAGTPEEMTVTARGERRVLDDPERELSALLGWWLPVDSLRAWLLGLADPRYPADTRIGPDGVLERLEQRLWRVDYEAFQLAGGVLVPRRVQMRHAGLEIRLTVDAWEPADTLSLN